ncbi:hypothetical protein, partial [Xanthomonas phaseoli]|uniref:hypothetical protein n=1 Tax=Xanthomonas phaseoli TaxID=1985254 RepID=UPI001ED961F9
MAPAPHASHCLWNGDRESERVERARSIALGEGDHGLAEVLAAQYVDQALRGAVQAVQHVLAVLVSPALL